MCEGYKSKEADRGPGSEECKRGNEVGSSSRCEDREDVEGVEKEGEAEEVWREEYERGWAR